MCGIIGYVSTGDEVLKREKEGFLHDALIVDTFRGHDSTGLLTVCEDFTVAEEKELLQGWDFVRLKKYAAMPEGWAAVGHNRAATKGKVNRDNAHPFTFGPVKLVHNGTLTNMGRNLPNYSGKVTVDSRNITRAIGHVPVEDAHKVLSDIDGAYALAWFDERDQSLNIARNGQRPLHFAHNTANTILWFMSEGSHLDLLKRSNWCFGVDMGTIFSFKTHIHYKWKKGSIIPEEVAYRPFVWGSGRANNYPSQNAQARGSTESKQSDNAKPASGSVIGTHGKPRVRMKATSSRRIIARGATEKQLSVLLEDLELTTDLTFEDELRFKPCKWTRYPSIDGVLSKRGYVVGFVWQPAWECDWLAIVHGIDELDQSKVARKEWAVIPYGTTHDIPKHEEYGVGVMCQLTQFFVAPQNDPVEDKDDDDSGVSFPGPFGRDLTEDDWLELTKRGCSHCSKELDSIDAEDVWWVGEMEASPLCGPCADFFTKPAKRDEEIMNQ